MGGETGKYLWSQFTGDSHAPQYKVEINDKNRMPIIESLERSLRGVRGDNDQFQFSTDTYNNILLQRLYSHSKEEANANAQYERNLRTREKNQSAKDISDSIISGEEGAVGVPAKPSQRGLGNYSTTTKDTTFLSELRNETSVTDGLLDDAINEDKNEISYNGDIYTKTTFKNGNTSYINKDGEDISPMTRILQKVKDNPALQADVASQHMGVLQDIHRNDPSLLNIQDMEAFETNVNNFGTIFGSSNPESTVNVGRTFQLAGEGASMGAVGGLAGAGLKAAATTVLGKALGKQWMTKAGKYMNDWFNPFTAGNRKYSAAGLAGAHFLQDSNDMTGEQTAHQIAGAITASTGLMAFNTGLGLILDMGAKKVIKGAVVGKNAFESIFGKPAKKEQKKLNVPESSNITDAQVEKMENTITAILRSRMSNQEKKEAFVAFSSEFYKSGHGGVKNKRTNAALNKLKKAQYTIENYLTKESKEFTLVGVPPSFRSDEDTYKGIQNAFENSANSTGLPQFHKEYGKELISMPLDDISLLSGYVTGQKTKFLFRKYAPEFTKAMTEKRKQIAQYKTEVAQAKGLSFEQFDQIPIPDELSRIDIPLEELHKIKNELGAELDKTITTQANRASYNKEKKNISTIIEAHIGTLGDDVLERYTKANELWGIHKTNTQPISAILDFINKNGNVMHVPKKKNDFQKLIEDIWKGQGDDAGTSLARVAIDGVDEGVRKAKERGMDVLMDLQNSKELPQLRHLIAEAIMKGNKTEAAMMNQAIYRDIKLTQAHKDVFDGLTDEQKDWAVRSMMEKARDRVGIVKKLDDEVSTADDEVFTATDFNKLFQGLKDSNRGDLIDDVYGKGYMKELGSLAKIAQLTKTNVNANESAFLAADNKGIFKAAFDLFDRYGISIDGLSNNLLHMAYRRVGSQWLALRYGTRILKTMSDDGSFKKSFNATMDKTSEILDDYLVKAAARGGIPKDIGKQILDPQSKFWQDALKDTELKELIEKAARSNGFVFAPTGGISQSAIIGELTKDDDDKQ